MNPTINRPASGESSTDLREAKRLGGLTRLTAFGTFLRELISNPRSIGAAFPSSRSLAAHMASFIPTELEGLVVELGAGTGVVTSALMDRGLSPDRVIAIEQSKDLSHLLKKRFPQLAIIHGDASFLGEILARHFEGRDHSVDFVVSGLPLRSLPKATLRAIEGQLYQVLSKRGRYIQFTYDLRWGIDCPFRDFAKCESKVIWQNLPPARVDVFQRKNSPC